MCPIRSYTGSLLVAAHNVMILAVTFLCEMYLVRLVLSVQQDVCVHAYVRACVRAYVRTCVCALRVVCHVEHAFLGLFVYS